MQIVGMQTPIWFIDLSGLAESGAPPRTRPFFVNLTGSAQRPRAHDRTGIGRLVSLRSANFAKRETT